MPAALFRAELGVELDFLFVWWFIRCLARFSALGASSNDWGLKMTMGVPYYFQLMLLLSVVYDTPCSASGRRGNEFPMLSSGTNLLDGLGCLARGVNFFLRRTSPLPLKQRTNAAYTADGQVGFRTTLRRKPGAFSEPPFRFLEKLIIVVV